MTKHITLEHIGIAARDATALREWYERVLGAELVWEISKEPAAALVNLGGVTIEIYSADRNSELTRDNKLAGWRHIVMRWRLLLASFLRSHFQESASQVWLGLLPACFSLRHSAFLLALRSGPAISAVLPITCAR